MRIRTLWPSCVQLLHAVVQADPDRGEGHLSLQSCHQPIVQAPRPLRPHNGHYGAKHASVFHRLTLHRRPAFPLDL